MEVDRAARRIAGAGALFAAATGLPAPSLAAGADFPAWGFGSHMHNVAAAAIFGGILGLFALAANRPLRPSLRRIGAGVLAFLALWFGACVIGLSGSFGLGSWPLRAFRPAEAALAALLLVVAALPHAALPTLSRLRRGA